MLHCFNLFVPRWPFRVCPRHPSSIPSLHVFPFSVLSGAPASSRSWEGVGRGRLWPQQLQKRLGFLHPQAACFFRGLSEFGVQQLPGGPQSLKCFRISPYYGLKNVIILQVDKLSTQDDV